MLKALSHHQRSCAAMASRRSSWAPGRLAAVAVATPSAFNATSYADIVRSKGEMRQLIEAASEIMKLKLRYINAYGQIEPIGKTGLSEKQQRNLAVAIKRARHLGLLPFVANN